MLPVRKSVMTAALVLSSLLVCPFAGGKGKDKEQPKVQEYRLKQACQQATQRSEHRRALVLADCLLDMALIEDDDYFKAYAFYYQGISNVITGNPVEGKQQLDSAAVLADRIDNDTLRLQIHNGYGIYEAGNHSNPALAQWHFFKALEYAVRIGDGFRQSMMESNLAEIAHIRRDSTGIKYAVSCYEWGCDNDNPQMMFAGAYQCASLYHMVGNNDRALEYAGIADKVLQEYGHQDEESSLCQLRGAIALDMGKLDEAVKWLDKAVETTDRAQAATLPEIYLCYALVYARRGEIVRSDAMIEKGLRVCDSLSISSALAQLYELRAQNMERSGNFRGALAAYKQYKQQCDSIYTIQELQSINGLRVQYDIDKRERDANFSRLMLDNERKRNAILVISLCSVIIILIILLMYFQKLRRVYKKIVIQHREEVARNRKPVVMPSEKADAMYERLCRMMEEDQIYTDCDLTRDKVAELLGTNRTYLTQIINEKSGKSYPQFVNDYRIRHAVRVLSDAGAADYPLKALCADVGFSSLSSFYKSFQNAVGMTPSMYKNVSKGI